MKLDEFFAGAAGGCQAPGCTHPHESVVMSPACHKGSATFIEADAKKRTFKITCSTCNKVVVTVECPFLN